MSVNQRRIDSIFSVSRNLGGQAIDTWDQAGGTGDFVGKPISLFGRNAASGTYGYFKEVALGNGDYRDTVKEQPGSSAVVQGVAADKYAIGYSGIGYKTADVRAVPLAADASSPFIPAAPEYAYTGEYPLARFLYVYVNHKPGSEMDPLRREFIRYVFSKQGQSDVVKDGYYPVPAEIAVETLEKLGIR